MPPLPPGGYRCRIWLITPPVFRSSPRHISHFASLPHTYVRQPPSTTEPYSYTSSSILNVVTNYNSQKLNISEKKEPKQSDSSNIGELVFSFRDGVTITLRVANHILFRILYTENKQITWQLESFSSMPYKGADFSFLLSFLWRYSHRISSSNQDVTSRMVPAIHIQCFHRVSIVWEPLSPSAYDPSHHSLIITS